MIDPKKDIELLRKKEESVLTSGERKLWQSFYSLDEAKDNQIQRRSKEFSNEAKAPQISEIETGLTRRGFLKWIAGTGALMGAAGCSRRPVDTLVPYVNKPEEFVYGKPVWYASSAPNGMGVLVKTREGRPIHLKGNPDHPGNGTGLDAQTQASILDLYNPERVRGPIDTKTGSIQSWSSVDQSLRSVFASSKPQGVRILTGPETSPSTSEALSQFVKKYRAKKHTYAGLSQDPIGRAHEIVTGQDGVPTYQFDQAEVVVSVGADFLGSWLRPVEYSRQFMKNRRTNLDENPKGQNRLFVFESLLTNTGVAADNRYRIHPSQQLAVLLAIANELSSSISVGPELKTLLKKYSVDEVAAQIEVAPEAIKEVAFVLKSARGKSLIVSGGQGPHALAVQLATIILNWMLRSYGSTIDFSSSLSSVVENDTLQSLLADMEAGNVEALVIHGANPAYGIYQEAFESALKKVPQVIYIGSEFNETAKLSNTILGESHFLEAWGDNQVTTGLVNMQQPVIDPLFNTRSFGEMLLSWSEGEPQDYRLFVQKVWRKNFYSGAGAFGSWWHDVLRTGFIQVGGPSRRSFTTKWSGLLAILNDVKPSEAEDVELVVYRSVNLGEGMGANNAWLQELPDPVTKITWGNAALVSPELAKRIGILQDKEDLRETKELGIKKHNILFPMVRVRSGDKQVELPAYIQPGLASNVVAIAYGYGRKNAGTLGTGLGANVNAFIEKSNSGEVQTSGISVDITSLNTKGELACTQLHFDIHGRDKDILQQLTLSEFQKNPRAAQPAKIATFSIYDEKNHVYPGHKWGMAVDLNTCTGCNACVVACQSENNIPVVGAEQVKMGRHMAWLRMDLYYTLEPSLPEAAYQPMMCVNCDSAPCETVCPVLATTHSSDGLNQMTYNRCVGTRYCANNCPYKVRRFNYFSYSDDLAGKLEITPESPLAMMLNPDVTVRSRGVMEKCTYCVQRIRTGVNETKSGGQKVALEDGAIKTACQESCPTDCISFGDLNDPNSRVTELHQRAQSFKVLEILNTRPSTVYLPRIRNKGQA